MSTRLRLADEPPAPDLTQLLGHVSCALRGIADVLDGIQPFLAARPVEAREVEDEPPLFAEDAAVALGVPYRSLMRMVHAGEIGYVKPGRRYLIPRTEITKYLASAGRRSA